MVKRRLIILALLALLGGAALAVHASTLAAAHPATNHAAMQAVTYQPLAAQPTPPADKAADNDARAPCATDAAGNQTGNCQDSQNAAGPEDSGTPEAAAGPDKDAVQTGP
jgi:hypothetical protein